MATSDIDNGLQVISHPNLSNYVAEQHSHHSFDAIIDIVGADDNLYLDSTRYLAPEGAYPVGGKMEATHGGGILNFLSFLIILCLRMYWPVFLGGVPRKLMFYSADIDSDSLRKLSDLVESGRLRGVVDSEWEMEDLVQASRRGREFPILLT